MRKHSLKVLWLIAMLVLTSSAFAQRIAIFDFNAGTGVTQVEVDGLSAIFNTYFEPKGAQIIERTRVDRLLQEHKFQKSKFTTSDMVAMGEQLNASLVVVGDVNIVMDQYNVDIRVVNVQTGTVVAKDGISFDKNTSYRGTMQQLGERLAKKMELEIEKINIESKSDKPEIKGGGKQLPKNMTTKITEDNSKRERTDVVVLHGYLKLYPEDLGEFGEKPSTLIRKINDEEKYGYDSWRLPTEEEMDIIRSNGYLSGLKYMTQSEPRGVLLLVTTKDPVVHKSKLQIAKHEFSIHGGIGASQQWKTRLGFSMGIKYKYKPFNKYDIRLFGEIGTAFTFNEDRSALSVLPVMAGINYEYRFTETTSIWGDLGFGVSIPLSERRYYMHGELFHSFKPGLALSPEIGVRYNDFSFSFKFIYSMQECGYVPPDPSISYLSYYRDLRGNCWYPDYESMYFLFQVGYHF